MPADMRGSPCTAAPLTRWTIVIVEKNGSFGTGDVTINDENVELVLISTRMMISFPAREFSASFRNGVPGVRG